MRTITGIDLIFENMEDAQIPSSCIGSLEVDLHARIGRSGQKIEKTEKANSVVLELLPAAAGLYSEDGAEPRRLFDRLRRCDITCLRFHFDDGSWEDCSVPYDDGDDFFAENSLQTDEVLSNGGMRIRIVENDGREENAAPDDVKSAH